MAEQGNPTGPRRLPLWLSLIPIIVFLGLLAGIIIAGDAGSISEWSPSILLGCSALALGLCVGARGFDRTTFRDGMMKSCRQILPTVPLLILIALVSTTWMLCGLVPMLISFGMKCLDPQLFLVAACAICAFVSVLTGSSWTTIATVGVALTGIGAVMGHSTGWICGAIISGAYFGDKVSPLSDTTVVASGSCGVDLFDHIRYLFITTVPSLAISLAVFLTAGLLSDTVSATGNSDLAGLLDRTFNLSPWLLMLPLLTAVLIGLRVPTLWVLGASVAAGITAMFVFQPAITARVDLLEALWSSTEFHTENAAFNDLVSTSGLLGMIPTIELVLAAMVFGGTMMGTGMLKSIAESLTRRLRRRTSIVSATVGSGLLLNGCTADQYLALIIGANMYNDVYSRFGLEPRLLSRTLEDSTSVTSVLVPWNTCGVAQSSVLGVPTLAYVPYCVFNYVSPLMSIAMVWTGFRIFERKPKETDLKESPVIQRR